MSANSRMTIAVHVLAWMAFVHDMGREMVTSDQIATSVSTNAVVIRRSLADLRDAGLVTVRHGAGAAGAWPVRRSRSPCLRCTRQCRATRFSVCTAESRISPARSEPVSSPRCVASTAMRSRRCGGSWPASRSRACCETPWPDDPPDPSDRVARRRAKPVVMAISCHRNCDSGEG